MLEPAVALRREIEDRADGSSPTPGDWSTDVSISRKGSETVESGDFPKPGAMVLS
jgi:hypothetical protein